MPASPLRKIFSLLFAAVLLTGISFGSGRPRDVVQAAGTGTIFIQPINPQGRLLLSSWKDPDGSNNDRYVWDSFTLPVDGTITEIDWIGGFDPLAWGAGGPVIDFNVSIYPSIAAGTEPAIAGAPLAEYLTGGNAGQTSYGTVGTIPMFSYAYILPVPFNAAGGTKYWVHIYAYQHGTRPDWGLAGGLGGNAYHYAQEMGAGGNVLYRSVPNDAAFSLVGPISDTPLDITLSKNSINENLPANSVVGLLGATNQDPAATHTFSLTCAVPGADDSSFNVFGSELRTNAIFHYSVKPVFNICIRASTQSGAFLDRGFVVTVYKNTYLPFINSFH